VVNLFFFNTFKWRFIPLITVVCFRSGTFRALLVNECNLIFVWIIRLFGKRSVKAGYACLMKRETSRWQPGAVKRDDLARVQTPPATRPVYHRHLSAIELNTRPARRLQLISAAISVMNSDDWYAVCDCSIGLHVPDVRISTSLISEDMLHNWLLAASAVITIAIRLRYDHTTIRSDYDPITTYRARLLPFDANNASKKWTCQFFVVVVIRIVVVS